MVPAMKKPIRVLTNDDGWILSTYGPQISVADLRDKMVAPHAGTPFDTFTWSVGGREVFSYETEIGERFAQDVGDFADPAAQIRAENLRHLIAEHGGPVTAISQLCHQAGMKFFASLRMNTHYNTADDDLSYGSFRRQHPQWLIGRSDEELHPGSLLWGLRTGKDFAFPAVRDFMNDIASELVERFDVDGIELDFMRHPGNFRPDEAYAHRYLLTDMVQHLRRRMDDIGKARGRDLELAVRVAPTLEDSERLGLEAGVWIEEGLVDLVVVGLGFNPFAARIDDFAAAAQGTDCRILGCFEALRPVLDTEVLRAIAARYWDAGADGLYFFNFYSMSAEWKRNVVGELADPALLSRLDKIYEIDKDRGYEPDSQIGHAFRYCLPLEQLPLRLEETRAGRAASLRFELADDIAAAERDGVLESCVLGLGFDDLAEGDEVELRLNGQVLVWDQQRRPAAPWARAAYAADWAAYPSRVITVSFESTPVEFDLEAAWLGRGENQLDIRLVRRGYGAVRPLALQDVRIWIRYRDKI